MGFAYQRYGECLRTRECGSRHHDKDGIQEACFSPSPTTCFAADVSLSAHSLNFAIQPATSVNYSEPDNRYGRSLTLTDSVFVTSDCEQPRFSRYPADDVEAFRHTLLGRESSHSCGADTGEGQSCVVQVCIPSILFLPQFFFSRPNHAKASSATRRCFCSSKQYNPSSSFPISNLSHRTLSFMFA